MRLEKWWILSHPKWRVGQLLRKILRRLWDVGLERERPGTMRGQEAAEGEGRGVSGDQRTQAGWMWGVKDDFLA